MNTPPIRDFAEVCDDSDSVDVVVAELVHAHSDQPLPAKCMDPSLRSG